MTAVDRLGRAWELYRRTASTRSAILLLIANAIPLVGVLFFDWSLLTILALYWLENGIVGLWNVPKILLAQGSLVPQLSDLPAAAARAATGSEARAAELQEQWRQVQAAQARGVQAPARPRILGPQAAARLSAIPRAGLTVFFAIHYGIFWFVHGIFVFTLPTFAGMRSGGSRPGDVCFDPTTGFPVECGTSAFGELLVPAVVIGAVALFLSHGASVFLNYIGRGEYLTASPGRQMGGVYGRVVVLHLTILLGAFVVALIGSPIGALLVLVVLKTAFDLNLHLRERRNAALPLPPVATVPPAVTLPPAT